MRSHLLNLLLGFSLIVTTLVAMPAVTKEINQQTIVIFGDSLSAAYGIKQEEGWVAQLQQRLTQHSILYKYKVINASISGETSSGGLNRFSEMLKVQNPNIVLIALGANDGLRGLSLAEMYANLNAMIKQAKAAKVEVLLLGMKIPPNYGLKYSRQFNENYKKLAKEHAVKLVPFFLDGVAGKPSLIQDDGLHPTAAAQPRILDNVWPQFKLLLKKS